VVIKNRHTSKITPVVGLSEAVNRNSVVIRRKILRLSQFFHESGFYF